MGPTMMPATRDSMNSRKKGVILDRVSIGLGSRKKGVILHRVSIGIGVSLGLWG